MSRYIDADAFEKRLEHACDSICEYPKKQRHIMCNACSLWIAIDIFERTPTADVVEVVRCKDCKWNKSTPHNPICSNDDMPKDVGFFCADGERREDEQIH